MLGMWISTPYITFPFQSPITHNTMSLNLKEVSEFMISNGYILPLGQGKFKLSTKFSREMRELLKQPVRLIPQRPTDTSEAICRMIGYVNNDSMVISSWEQQYKQFIIESKVPSKLETGKGELYTANGYSEKGMKAFRRALESGADPILLIRATTLYYASAIRYKQAIGRFMEEGTWKTFYEQLVNAIENGEEALIKHVKQELDDGTNDRYKLG